jgi:hypothetical protein
MNGSSRFARHRGELLFAKGLIGNFYQHFDVLELKAPIEIPPESEEATHLLTSLIGPWKPKSWVRLGPAAKLSQHRALGIASLELSVLQ